MKRIVTAALICTLIVMLALPSYASLIPMSWGFPTLSESNTLSSMETAFTNANDLETSSISFPTTDAGALSTSFPTIVQTADQNSIAMKLSKLSQIQSSSFAYPWLSIGLSAVPSMGML